MALTILTGSSQAAATNYSYTTSGSADWASVPTASYFYDITDKTVRYKTPSSEYANVPTASYAVTASYALNAGGAATPTFPYTGSAIISGSLIVTGSVNVRGSISGSFTGSFSGSHVGPLVGTASWASNAVLAPTYLPLAGGTLTGNLSAAGRLFTFQDLTLGAGTTFGTIKTDGAKYIGIYPNMNFETTRFYANGHIGFQNGGTYTDTGFRVQISASNSVSGRRKSSVGAGAV